jgi:hypothetical protein
MSSFKKQKMKLPIILYAGVYFLNALACGAGKSEGREIVNMVINHYKVPCVGEGTQLCYLTKKDNQSAWEFLFEGIDGFQYQWGKVYELEVEKSIRKDTKADQSPIAYKLIRIINSKDAPADEPFPLMVKDVDMVAIKKDEKGQFSLLGLYPFSCSSPLVCEELEERLQSQANITGLYQHSADHQSLVLQSLKN